MGEGGGARTGEREERELSERERHVVRGGGGESWPAGERTMGLRRARTRLTQ